MHYKNEKSKYNAIFNMAMLYPLVNILLSFFANNEGLMTLYFCSSLFLIGVYLFTYNTAGFHIKKSILVYFVILIATILWIWLIDSDVYSRSQSIIFALGMLIWMMLSKIDLSERCLEWIKRSELYINVIRCVYYVIILASVIRGDGMNFRWETMTLSGPYPTSHLLAYELVIWAMIDAIYIVQKKGKKYILVLVFDSALMILTAARSVLIPLIIIMWFVLRTYKSQKRIVIAVSAVILGVILLRYTNLFEAFLEKTQRAIRTSTITSGRGMIFKTSLDAFFAAPLAQKVLGMGINNLMDYNKHHIWMDIHAHNDYIDALVQYGIVGLGLYLYAFKRLIRNSNAKISMIMIVSLAFFNGFYVSNSAMIATVIFLAFDKAITYKGKERQWIKPIFGSITRRQRYKES